MVFLFALLFLLLILVFARQAWQSGVLIQYWGISGLLGGILAGYFFFQNSATILERLAPEYELPLIPNVIASVAIALVIYFIVRSLMKSLLQSMIEEGTWLSACTEGFRGAVLSLIPSLLTVFVLASGIRMAGTLLELKKYEYVCRPGVDFSAKDYPNPSVWATWRNSVEEIPYLQESLDIVDPISRVRERRVVALLVASKKPELLEYLRKSPETAGIYQSRIMQDLLVNDEINLLLNQYQHVSLIRHPLVRQAANLPELADVLRDLELQQVVDRFMLSAERLERIKNETVVMIQS